MDKEYATQGGCHCKFTRIIMECMQVATYICTHVCTHMEYDFNRVIITSPDNPPIQIANWIRSDFDLLNDKKSYSNLLLYGSYIQCNTIL